MKRLARLLASAAILLASPAALAAPEPARADDLLGRPLALVAALALVSLLPFLFMSVTAFVKISTVLQITRSAIGAQNVPSSTVVMALAAALTLLAMAPVGEKIATRASPLLRAKGMDTAELVTKAIDAVKDPMREFHAANASDREKTRFFEVAKGARKDEADRARVSRDDVTVLVPAFVTTELTEAFAIGFLIYLPFLVIDLVVANIIVALGMQAMSPAGVSLPFKLLLFVVIDGWGLLAQALVVGYR